MFFRFVTSGEIRRRSDFFEPFIAGLTNSTVDQVCFDFLPFTFIKNTSFLLPSSMFFNYIIMVIVIFHSIKVIVLADN